MSDFLFKSSLFLVLVILLIIIKVIIPKLTKTTSTTFHLNRSNGLVKDQDGKTIDQKKTLGKYISFLSAMVLFSCSAVPQRAYLGEIKDFTPAPNGVYSTALVVTLKTNTKIFVRKIDNKSEPFFTGCSLFMDENGVFSSRMKDVTIVQ